MSELRPFLERVYQRFHKTAFMGTDPISFSHRYSDPYDREAVALVSALLAYGNVQQIRASVEEVLIRISRIGRSPSQWVRTLGSAQSVSTAVQEFRGFKHRFHLGSDVVLLFQLLHGSWERHGNLGTEVASRMGKDDPDFSQALSSLIQDWKKRARSLKTPRGPYFEHLLTSPSDGSVCKRWAMLLRWMVRKDELDLGLWSPEGEFGSSFKKKLLSRHLVMPLDTHTGRLSQYLGLTERRTLNWKAAREITDRLMECDPQDPVRFDFSLCRLGILDLCQKRFNMEICKNCDLLPVCRYAQGRRNLSA